MITGDLLRVYTRKGVIKPRYIDIEDESLLALAESLIAVFDAHLSSRRSEVMDAALDVGGEGVEPLLRRGLMKLLEDRSQFDVKTAVDPKEIRKVVFGMAAQVHPVTMNPGEDAPLIYGDGGLKTAESGAYEQAVVAPPRGFVSRDVILEKAGEILGLTVEETLDGLYGDLPRAHALMSFKTLTPSELLSRYNTGLAQAVLLRATKITLILKKMSQKRLRQVFRAIKFRRLMYRISEEGKGGYRVELDGPVSLFKASSRYGLNMALFLPALLNTKGWKIEADLSWGKKKVERMFTLSPRQGLVGHYKDRGMYQTQQETWFLERFKVYKTEWVLKANPPFLQAGPQGLIVPDYALHHPDGRVAYLEILGFWRKGALLTRLKQLEDAGLEHLILAVSKSLQGSVDALKTIEGSVVYFREIIPPKAVVDLAEKVSRLPTA